MQNMIFARSVARQVQDGTKEVVADARAALAVLRRERSAQIVIVLAAIPWIVSIAIHRDVNVWMPLAEIGGIVVVYWFFTRRLPYRNLPVRRPKFEVIVVVVYVALWILYRIAEYLRLLVLPPLTVGCCGNLSDTTIPKTIEMFLLPLAFFLALHYSPKELGLGLPLHAWLPALLPLAAFVLEGLNRQQPAALADRTVTFYFAAGLPEEFLFRGLLMSRLEATMRRPAWGLFLSGFLFGVSHLPIDLYGAGWEHWQIALESAFTFQMGIGLALGFAFQRCRNLWPLTFIHALIDAAPMM